MLFEAPTKDLQVELITNASGPEGEPTATSATDDVIPPLETLRRGLRGDTLLALTAGMGHAAQRFPSAA